MKILKLRFLPAVVCVSLLGIGGVQAADDPNLARVWAVTPKPGMDQQLEDAMKAHNKWRVDNGDPWSWSTYHRSTGDDLGTWFIRSGNHTYADFDAYGDSEFAKKAYEHWMANVEPYVANSASHLSENLPDLSHWPADAGPHEWYWVYTYKLKPGNGRAFVAA
ncbi:MAG: hypothetical protein ACR2QU_02200, partial [Gammaproteobacteria bacterium]